MTDKNKWEERGVQDGKSGAKVTPPSTTRVSDRGLFGRIVEGVLTGGVGTVLDAMSSTEDKEKTSEADSAYLRGYEQGINYRNKVEELEAERKKK